MNNKQKVIDLVYEKKIVAIFRGIDVSRVSKAANALYEGGISLCEVTFNMKERENGFQSTLDSIRAIVQGKGDRKLIVGAGTVLTVDQVVLAHDAGAEFIITPSINTEVIKCANELGMMTMPGGYSPTELEEAYEAGADFVKIFPASEAGPSYFKAVGGPLSHIPLVAVGGVNENNTRAFLENGAVGFGIGGNLVDEKLINADRYTELTELATKFVASF